MISDLKFALRQLAKNPGFTAVALATLGLGIGATSAIYTFVDAALLRPLPFRDPDRIVHIGEKAPWGAAYPASTLDYLDWRQQSTVFEAVTARTSTADLLEGVEEPIQVQVERVTARYFDVLGARTALGRTFAPNEDQPGKDHVVVLENAFWKSEFGGDPGIVGRTLTLNGEGYTVIGVLAAIGTFHNGQAQLWRPLTFTSAQRTRDFYWLWTGARLKPGATLAQARTEMDVIAARLARQYPATNKGWGCRVERYADSIVGGQLRLSLWLVFAAVAAVWLIGCVNLGNLTLARTLARERELAVRAALGATRGRLARHLLIESALLGLAGGSVGVAVGYAGMAVLNGILPAAFLPSQVKVTLDGRVLLFTLALSLVSGLCLGALPAWLLTRRHPADALGKGGRATGSGLGRRRARAILIAGEMALAFTLLASTGLLLRSLYSLRQRDLGFDGDRVLTATFVPIPKRAADAAAFTAYLHQVTDALRAVPGVETAAFTTRYPLLGRGWNMPFRIDGAAPMPQVVCGMKLVDPAYFRALRIKLDRGRLLNSGDTAASPPVMVINETMARLYFPGSDPIGRRLLIPTLGFGQIQLGPEKSWEIVGVIHDERIDGLEAPDNSPEVYMSIDQNVQPAMQLVVRGTGKIEVRLSELNEAVRSVEKLQALHRFGTMDQVTADSVGNSRFRLRLFAAFAGLAVVLAAVGLYGVASYSLAQRTREIGVRLALGATPRQIKGVLLREGAGVAGFGLGVGLLATLGLGRLLASVVPGAHAADPEVLAVAASLLLATALLASWIPARRASRVDPLIALRAE